MTNVIDDVSPDVEGEIGPRVASGASPADSGSASGGDRFVLWSRILAIYLLPAVALLLAVTAGYLKWLDSSQRESRYAATESVQDATNGAIAILSYRPDTIDADLEAARSRLTGAFRDQYSALMHDVVIPGSKQSQISAVATVPAAASVSSNGNKAVVLIFVNQKITAGDSPPSDSTSAIRVTLDKANGSWLISEFDPV